MRLYLIRHAQSVNNALEDIRERVIDPDLTPLGEEQAAFLADYLATQQDTSGDDYAFTHVYTSAMLRSLKTARYMAKALNVQPHVWTAIHEQGGIYLHDTQGHATGYPGMTRGDIAAAFPGFVLPDDVTENGWWDAARGQEAIADFISRAIMVGLHLLERAESNDHIVLVSHASFLDVLIKGLLHQLPTRPNQMFYRHYNTGITRFDFADELDYMRLHYLNSVAHLPPGKRSW